MKSSARKQEGRRPKMSGSHDVDLTAQVPRDDGMTLPFERDESPDRTDDGTAPRAIIEQAARDIRHGLKDTERRGTPSDVPGPPPVGPAQAEVPADGVDVDRDTRQPGRAAGGARRRGA